MAAPTSAQALSTVEARSKRQWSAVAGSGMGVRLRCGSFMRASLIGPAPVPGAW